MNINIPVSRHWSDLMETSNVLGKLRQKRRWRAYDIDLIKHALILGAITTKVASRTNLCHASHTLPIKLTV